MLRRLLDWCCPDSALRLAPRQLRVSGWVMGGEPVRLTGGELKWLHKALVVDYPALEKYQTVWAQNLLLASSEYWGTDTPIFVDGLQVQEV